MFSRRWRTPLVRRFHRGLTWLLIWSDIGWMVAPGAALPSPASQTSMTRPSQVLPRVQQAMNLLDFRPGPAGMVPKSTLGSAERCRFRERVVPGRAPSLPLLPDTKPRADASATPCAMAAVPTSNPASPMLLANADGPDGPGSGNPGSDGSNDGDNGNGGVPHGSGVDKGLAYLTVPGSSTQVPPSGWSGRTIPVASTLPSPVVRRSPTIMPSGSAPTTPTWPIQEPRTILWDFTSPVATNNVTSRHTAASLELHYTSTGASPSAFDAHYTLQWKVYDANHPAGNVVRTDQENTQLTSVYAFHKINRAATWETGSLGATRNGTVVDSRSRSPWLNGPEPPSGPSIAALRATGLRSPRPSPPTPWTSG